MKGTNKNTDFSFVLKYPTMDFSIKVIFATKEQLKEKYHTEVSGATKACFFTDYYWLWVDPQYLTPGIVAHESIHAINTVFENKGVEITMSNDEVLAYYVEDMVNKILDKHAKICSKRK